MRRLNSLINCQPGIRRLLKWHAEKTVTCFLLLTTVAAVQLYTSSNLTQLTTSCGHWNFDLVPFWSLAIMVAVAAKIQNNAAAALWMKYNSLQEQKDRLFILQYSSIRHLFCDCFCHHQDVWIYAAVSLPSRQVNTLWIFPSKYGTKNPSLQQLRYRGKSVTKRCVSVNKQLSSVINDLLVVLCSLFYVCLTSPPSISNNIIINRHYIIKRSLPPQCFMTITLCNKLFQIFS